jgi:hypothetical protein
MRVGRRVIFSLGILPLASCAVVGPVVDAGMENAPHQACVRFAEAQPPEPGSASGGGQCVSAQVRNAAGQWQPFTGTLNTGELLVAIPSPAPQCNHGNYTHFVIEGASDAGAMRVAVPDTFGRGDRGRDFSWNRPRTRWAADNIGSAVHTPAAARVTLSQGEVRISSACFKSYIHYRVPRPAEAARDEEHGADH